MNLLTMMDSYKAGHSRLYPKDMTGLFSYLESRTGGVYPACVFFGLQYYLQKYMKPITALNVAYAHEFWERHLGRDDYFDAALWGQMVKDHPNDLPVRIKAVPEGVLIPNGNVLMTIESTDEKYAAFVGMLETLLMKVWYPITIATQAYYLKKTLREAFERTGSDPSFADYAVHDFGYRGVSSEETAEIGGAAHLTSFHGTDTVAGIHMIHDYYDTQDVTEFMMPGSSIPATEHSVICAWGREHEDDCYASFLEQFPEGMIACVSDTYNLEHVVNDIWGGSLQNVVISRKGRLVVRPDSGVPTNTMMRTVLALARKFGVHENTKGFKVLDSHVRVIYGDGMTPTTIPEMYATLELNGFAAENLVVGSGGGLLQSVTRDTQRFAIKASAVKRGDTWHGISKDPSDDHGKRSKAGRLALITAPDVGYMTFTEGVAAELGYDNQLITVFDGRVQYTQDFHVVRGRIKDQMNGGTHV